MTYSPRLPILSAALLVVAALAFRVVWAENALPTVPFPVVDTAMQKARDDTRRQILQSELTTKMKAYEDANGALSAAISAKQPAEKIDALKQAALEHRKNVEAIHGELVSLNKAAGGSKSAPVAVRAHAAAAPANAQRPVPYWDVYNRSQVQPPDTQ